MFIFFRSAELFESIVPWFGGISWLCPTWRAWNNRADCTWYHRQRLFLSGFGKHCYAWCRSSVHFLCRQYLSSVDKYFRQCVKFHVLIINSIFVAIWSCSVRKPLSPLSSNNRHSQIEKKPKMAPAALTAVQKELKEKMESAHTEDDLWKVTFDDDWNDEDPVLQDLLQKIGQKKEFWSAEY